MEDDTSVRVAVRIRPQIAREIIDMCRICTSVTPEEPQVTLGSDKSFTYDYVFDTISTQDEIYEMCVSRLIEGSLEGYNATVLAYGQTGSGKTYTMGTGFEVDLDQEQVGIIPRAIHHLFGSMERLIQTAREAGEPPPEFKVSAQFMELYNEEVIDLFEPVRDPLGSRIRGGAKIHEDTSGAIYVTGVTLRPIVSADDALQCLKLGALSRTTGSTQMNAQSSRSHAIFTLHIKQQRIVRMNQDIGNDPMETGSEFETLTSKFHFVDLAGSERLKRTGATGERAKEGISINCGLLALGNVISALGDKSKKALHVPYRDSKLTRLLQDSLGGNSQTVMIACVSPSDTDFMETLNTLKYANRARNIKNRVTINQDKSSRTIALLRQEIQQLQLELQEYKQGKRIIGDDGEESMNDMYHENMMLQSELNKLRTRVKAMQETIDALSAKNSQLLAERAVGGWINNGSENDVTELIQGYLKEIEELRAKLLESESTCQQLRKAAAVARPPRGSIVMGVPFDSTLTSTSSLIEEAKRDLDKDRNRLIKRKMEMKDEKTNGVEGGNEKGDVDSENSDTEDKDIVSEDSDSDTDTEEKESQHEEYGLELAELNSEINIKQKLIEELELSQRRLQVMKQQYEDKLQQLQARIRATQEERDKVLASYSEQNNQPVEKVRKVKEEYERKLNDMQNELKRLQSAKKEHARLLRNQSQHENQIRQLKNDLQEMKRTKVRLVNKMKEEALRHKEADMQKKKEIAQLRKAKLRQEHQIRTLETDTKMKEAMLRRKNEEVTALKRANKQNMSDKAAGRVGPRHAAQKKSLIFSPKVAKQKWQALENNISKISLNKQAVAAMEREMERQISERERLSRDMDMLICRRNTAVREGASELLIQNLNEDIESTKSNIEYVQANIAESQQNIIQVEEGVDALDLGQNLVSLDEARYFIQKMYNMTVNQSYTAAQQELTIKELESKLDEMTQRHRVQDELLQHLMTNKDLLNLEGKNFEFSDTSAESSRSVSPTDTCNGNTRPSSRQISQKVRRKTALPQELLYGGVDNQEEQSDVNLAPNIETMFKVPTGPSSLRSFTSKPSPTAPRKTYDKLEATSPRLNRRTTNVALGSLLGKPGSMEQGLDSSPPNSPPSYRRLNSREENVFSRLTSGTTVSSDEQVGKGSITVYQGKVAAKAPLICTHVAEGHSRPVLSVYATDDLLFSASKDRTVKVWDLNAGTECHSLNGHPNNVVVVKYNEEQRLVFTASTAYVNIWDLRQGSVKCIKTLCSSGLTATGSITSTRQMELPPGEVHINDVALNVNGTALYTAAGDKGNVRLWDLRKFESTGKLSGGHTALVKCLAVGEISEQEDLVITGSKDHYIKVFEVNRESASVFTPTMNLNPPHYDGIETLALRGDILFSGSRDKSIKKWDLSRQELIQSINNAHKDWVCGLTFMPGGGNMILSGCRGGVVKLWSTETCNLLGEMKAHSSHINAITTNSNLVFTASNSGEVKIWKSPHYSAMSMSTVTKKFVCGDFTTDTMICYVTELLTSEKPPSLHNVFILQVHAIRVLNDNNHPASSTHRHCY